MENMIYYYNSDVIEQLFWQKHKKRISEFEDENNLSVQSQVEAELKFLIGKINPDITTDVSHKNAQKKVVSDLRYELQILNELFQSSIEVVTEQFPLPDNVIYRFLGNIDLVRIFIEEDMTWNVKVSFLIGDYILQGNTSIENWKSSSLLNRAIKTKTITCNVLFKRLQKNNKQEQNIQILAVFAW